MLITISRQFHAGGSEVGRVTADALGWTFVDNAFIEQVAARAGLTADEVARREERTPSFLERLSRTTAMAFPELFQLPAESVDEFEEDKLVKITRNLVSELATAGRMVIVGRAAAAVLAEAVDALHVRVIAPRPWRIERAAQLLEIDADEAARQLDEVDRNRERYHREYYGREWDDPCHYDLVLNAARLGVEGAAALISQRARDLGWTKT